MMSLETFIEKQTELYKIVTDNKQGVFVVEVDLDNDDTATEITKYYFNNENDAQKFACELEDFAEEKGLYIDTWVFQILKPDVDKVKRLLVEHGRELNDYDKSDWCTPYGVPWDI